MGQVGTTPTVCFSADCPTGNFWVDAGLVVLLEQFGEEEHDVQQVLGWLQSQLLQPSGNKDEYYDQASEQICEYDKVNWVYPTNLFIKVSGQAPKVRVDSKDYFLHPPHFELSLKLSKKTRHLRPLRREAPLTDATMWMYPFVVDPQKFGPFYPGTKRRLKLCARCALAGLAGYLGWLWKAQGRDALHFFIFHSELRKLRRLHREVLQPLRLSGEKGGTAPVAFSGPYVNETTLGLLLNLFQHVRQSDVLSDDARQMLAMLLGATEAATPAPITLYAITGTPGQAFQMKAWRGFSELERLYRLYESWLRVIIPEKPQGTEKDERIAGAPQVRAKTLLSIYAMNAYLGMRRGKENSTIVEISIKTAKYAQ